MILIEISINSKKIGLLILRMALNISLVTVFYFIPHNLCLYQRGVSKKQRNSTAVNSQYIFYVIYLKIETNNYNPYGILYKNCISFYCRFMQLLQINFIHYGCLLYNQQNICYYVDIFIALDKRFLHRV